MLRMWCGLMVVLIVVGCEKVEGKKTGAGDHAEESGREVTTAVAGNETAKKVVGPRYEKVQIGVFEGKTGESGCFTNDYRPVPEGASKMAGTFELICGTDGKSSRVKWDYLKTDEAGDHYRFVRKFPDEGPSSTTSTKEIVYAGKEQIVFQDEFQRVLIRPDVVK